ncbi:response regulator transcription factor [Longirhabdus pacifica]|uniref:response regulator transcription factor n=1 Tax=Longirhabdus pacifica TaxID=2305227 RepID=UPI001008E9FB|nr:response regulator transcription factor [Longirhabdus pacifica]
MSSPILIADDEVNITDVCKRYLEREGFTCHVAHDGEEALDKWKKKSPQLLILDLMMPKMDGWQLCKAIREESDVPIIMLTARGEESDRLLGLTIGADDYLTKPFSPQELVLRVKVILRRLKSTPTADTNQSIRFDDLEIHPSERSVVVRGHKVDLTMKEFDLLLYLAEHPGQVFSREQLLEHVWNIDFLGDMTTVTVHIRKLREKLEQDASSPTYIKTVWGIGYKFEGLK